MHFSPCTPNFADHSHNHQTPNLGDTLTPTQARAAGLPGRRRCTSSKPSSSTIGPLGGSGGPESVSMCASPPLPSPPSSLLLEPLAAGSTVPSRSTCAGISKGLGCPVNEHSLRIQEVKDNTVLRWQHQYAALWHMRQGKQLLQA